MNKYSECTITKETIEQEAVEFINNLAKSIVGGLLGAITREEGVRLYLGERVGATIDENEINRFDVTMEKAVTHELEKRGIKISFPNDYNFPESLGGGKYNCCIYIKDKTINAIM